MNHLSVSYSHKYFCLEHCIQLIFFFMFINCLDEFIFSSLQSGLLSI